MQQVFMGDNSRVWARGDSEERAAEGLFLSSYSTNWSDAQNLQQPLRHVPEQADRHRAHCWAKSRGGDSWSENLSDEEKKP